MKKRRKNNVLAIHGGGLVDPSKEVILNVVRELSSKHVYDEIYLGKYSFMSMYDHTLWMRYNRTTELMLKNERGTFFGTCRGIDMTKKFLMDASFHVLNDYQVSTVIVFGGDGSARNCAEISQKFLEKGINIIFAVPLTVDGINGGYSIGLEQAVRVAVRTIEDGASTSLETKDRGNFSVLAVKLQGRNRDDILANVLFKFWQKGSVNRCDLDDINLIVIPANYQTNKDNLKNAINSSTKRTLILVSEGAEIQVEELQSLTKRKVRILDVGHVVQSNNMTTKEDIKSYHPWLKDVADIIASHPFESFSIVHSDEKTMKKAISDGFSVSRFRKSTVNLYTWGTNMEYYAHHNPREGQNAELDECLETVIKIYMV